MSSPFTAFVNAHLRFQVATGTLQPDGKGNLKPGKAVVEVAAMLKQETKQGKEERRKPAPGVDETAIYIEGYLVEPLSLPGIITPDTPCQIEWQGRKGRFYVDFTAKNPFLDALNINLVNKLRGWFAPSSFVVEGSPWQPAPAPAPTSDGNQYTQPIAAATTLSALRVVRTNDANDSGLLVYASCDRVEDAFAVLGLLDLAVAGGESVRVLIDGIVTDAMWSWSRSQPVWLGVGGTLTQTAPTEGFLLQVATVINAQTLDFEIQEPILL